MANLDLEGGKPSLEQRMTAARYEVTDLLGLFVAVVGTGSITVGLLFNIIL